MISFLARIIRILPKGAMLSRPLDRVAQVGRHFSNLDSPQRKIRDVYILSAARTPTGKASPKPFETHWNFEFLNIGSV